VKDAVATGASIGLCYLSCNYFGYQLCLTLLFAAPLLLLRSCSVRRLGIGAAVIVAAVSAIVLPVVAKQLSTSSQQNWDRQSKTVSRLSAVQDDYFRTLWLLNFLWGLVGLGGDVARLSCLPSGYPAWERCVARTDLPCLSR
jgi:hypothetical protein